MVKLSKRTKKFAAKGGADLAKRSSKKRRKEKIKGGEQLPREQPARSRGEDHVAASVKSLESMNVDEFMNNIIEEISDDEDDNKNLLAEKGDDISTNAKDDDDVEEEEEEEEDGSSSEGMEDSNESSEEDVNEDNIGSLKEAVRGHRSELEALKDKDPEFLKFLQKNSPGLLDFEDFEDEEVLEKEESTLSGMDSGVDVESDKDGDDKSETTNTLEAAVSAPASSDTKTVELTAKELRRLEKNLVEEHSLRGLKRLVNMYRNGCHLNNPEAAPSGFKYSIGSAAVFNKLMVMSLQALHREFSYHLLKHDPDSGGISRPLTRLPNWNNIGPLVMVFFKATMGLLREATEMSLVAFIFRELEHYLAFLVPFPKMAKNYLKIFLKHWGSSQSPDADSRAVQISAFFRIRQLAMGQPFPFIEDCLKGLYLTFARNARYVNEQSFQGITFMGNCVVELFGIDTDASYQHCFVYIRQLALHLRNAMIKKTKEILQQIFSWQYLHCLKVWTRVVAQYPGDKELKALVFPLTQVITGVLKLALSPRLIPFRLHCVVMLHQLAASSAIFIPTAPYLLDILQSPDLHKKPKYSTDPPPILSDIIRFSDAGVSTKVQQDAVFQLTVNVLKQATDLYRYNIAFPEYAAPIISATSKLGKECKVGKWRAIAKALAESLQKQEAWIKVQRGALVETPKSLQKLETFLPPNTPSARSRLEASLEEANAARASQFAQENRSEKKENQKKKRSSLRPESEKGVFTAVSAKSAKKRRQETEHSAPSTKAAQSKDLQKSKQFSDVLTHGFSWESDSD